MGGGVGVMGGDVGVTGGDVGVMGGESGDVVVAELAAVELDSVGCVSVSDKFDWSSMLFVELQ